MLKVKFSSKVWAIKKRIKKLPAYELGVIRAKTKYDAYKVKQEFSAGIAKNRLGLLPLSPDTIRHKKGKKPNVPLYDKGGNDPRSYKNMMLIRQLKNGFKVYPSNRMHHSGKITLKYLFFIHEYGCVIKGKNNTLIRIPPRAALFLAYKSWMEKKSKRDISRKLKNAIIEYVNTGRLEQFKRIEKQFFDGIERMKD